MCDDGQKCLSVEKETRMKSKDMQIEKQNNICAKINSEQISEATSLDVYDSGKKKKHKKKRHHSNDAGVIPKSNESSETNCDASHTEDKIKQKKKKKEKPVSTKISETNCDASLVEDKIKLKKRKKEKAVSTETIEDHENKQLVSTQISETNCDANQVEDKIKLKKNKKRKKEKDVSRETIEDHENKQLVSTKISETNCDANLVEDKIKLKKNKKRKKEKDVSTETVEDNETNQVVFTQISETNCGVSTKIFETNCDASLVEDRIKLKKNKKKKEKDVATETVGDENTQSIKKKSKKRKKSKRAYDVLKIRDDGDNKSQERTENACLQISCESKNKKKCKKQKLEMHADNVECQDIKNNMPDKENPSSICEKYNTKHHKKNKKHSKCMDSSTLDEVKCKKHKNKIEYTSDISQENGDLSDYVHSHKLKRAASSDVETPNSRNRVSNNRDNSNIYEEESIRHHKKEKQQVKHRDSSSVNKIKKADDMSKCSNGSIHDSYSHKHVNELVLNESHSNKMAATSDSAAPVQGQWQGNLFDSSDRQNKFLRLMGGIKNSTESSGEKKKEVSHIGAKKKGLFGSLTSLVNRDSQSGGKDALSASAAASLNQKLEDEYNRALNFKLSGKIGTGFGFEPDPAEGKKFHIDVNKSKSFKFDD